MLCQNLPLCNKSNCASQPVARPLPTMKFILQHKLAITGIIVGAIAGYLYYFYVGCVSGTCSITSKPINSTLYGAMMGGLLLSMFKKEADAGNTEDDIT